MGKSTKSKYDKQFIDAQNRATAAAEKSQAWTEDFYDTWVAPLLKMQTDQLGVTTERLDEMFEQNLNIMQQQKELYDKYGVPAEQRYYSMFAAAADDSQAFFEKFTKPAAETYAETLASVSEQATKLLREGALPAAQAFYKMAEEQANSDAQLYGDYAKPAMESFYKMVNEFSAPAYEERQAALAMGDVEQAAGAQRGQLDRQLAAAGVSPNSPQAQALSQRLAVDNAALRASAAEKARTAAQALGIQLRGSAADFARGQRTGLEARGAAAEFGRGETLGLTAGGAAASMGAPINSSGLGLTADLAGFGRGYLGGTQQFSQMATGTATGGLGATQSAVSTANAGASVPTTGLNLAMTGFQNNANAWMSRVKADLDLRAANAKGLGEAIGGIAGAAASFAKG